MKKITFTNIAEKKMFAVLLASIVLSVFLYIFFIGVMSVSAAQRGGIEIQVRTTSSYISELESEYMSLENNITLSYAYKMGFNDPKEIAFATRKTFAVNFKNDR